MTQSLRPHKASQSTPLRRPSPTSQLDEGYSEAPHLLDNDPALLAHLSGDEVDMIMSDDSAVPSAQQRVTDALLQLPSHQRAEVIRNIYHSLPTALLSVLHDHLGSLVYFDPVRYLPIELILEIFSYLTPKDLLSVSLISRPWRERTHDEQLWHNCFLREGWVLDPVRMAEDEAWAKELGVVRAERLLRYSKPGERLERRGIRKRQRDEAFSGDERTRTTQDAGRPEGDASESVDGMEGVVATSFTHGTGRAAQGSPLGSARDAMMDLGTPPSSADSATPFDSSAAVSPSGLHLEPSVFTHTPDPKVSWPFLYKQRRRLERNWEQGKFTTFRLPHPDFPDEGHTECVYSIQYTGKWVASGSRDNSIRVWDLDTCRLRYPALRVHTASVLCLQFDDKPGDKHDIMISGSSDFCVIIWKFSTGEVIKKMEMSHTEPVLNLRFDDRYLITCSKDKTIKIWNRHEITKDDPIIPARMLQTFKEQEAPLIPPLTLLDTLTGHGAAVNAVQIHGNIIVSASGDRSIRAWDIHAGTFKKQYSTHTKGIACVQFDGRRVVSGSSDHSVRIFDFETQAEIAWLEGHVNLVRTVQARFGDLAITSDAELEAESRLADQRFLQHLDAGTMEPRDSGRRRQQPRNAGSARPQDMVSYGTKMPPGGGGSRWAKIVSGSYDETVIVWKRGRDGKWKVNQRLHLGRILNQDNLAARPRPNAVPPPPNNMTPAQAQQHLQAQHTIVAQAHAQLQQQGPPPPPVHAAPATANNPAATAQAHYQPQPQQAVAPAPGQAIPPPAMPANAAAQIAAHAAANHPAAANNNNPHPPMPANAAATAAAVAHHHHHHHAGGANPAQRTDTNRVFKLQFDARRIVACSQNRTIVGWDFAAGERDLELVGGWSLETG